MNSKKSPYRVIKSRYVTEKSQVLQALHTRESNPSLKKCKTPKYVFVVENGANKAEIAAAVEEIYQESQIKVVSVNTINVKSKPKMARGRPFKTSAWKKAVVTLRPGDEIPDNKV